MATDSLFVLAKTDNIYKDIAEDVEKDLTIMKYIEHFLKEKEKMIGLMKDKQMEKS